MNNQIQMNKHRSGTETISLAPSFWVTASLLLLWGMAGLSIYVAYFIETPEQFAQTAEDAAHREAYAEYISNIPVLALVLGIGAAVTRFAGAGALLLRSRWALPLYVLSALMFSVLLYRAFVTGKASEVMSAPHIAIEFIFLALHAYAIWFAYQNQRTGVLK